MYRTWGCTSIYWPLSISLDAKVPSELSIFCAITGYNCQFLISLLKCVSTLLIVCVRELLFIDRYILLYDQEEGHIFNDLN